jgi:4-amino-4-deoxy-L-arabinose transferase-like glycosyltransferase
VFDATRAGNDVLVALLATLAITLTLRWMNRLSIERGLAVGLVAGLAVLSKYTGVFCLLVIALLIIGEAWRAEPIWRRQAAWFLLTAMITCLVIVSPWLVFMRHTYGSFFPSAAYREALSSFWYLPLPRDWHLVSWVEDNARRVLFGEPGLDPLSAANSSFNAMLRTILEVLTLSGVVAVAWKGKSLGLSVTNRMVILASGPVLFVMLLVMSVTSGINLIPTGRYDLPVVLPVGVILAAGPALVAPARGRPAMAGVLAIAALALAAHDVLLSPSWVSFW